MDNTSNTSESTEQSYQLQRFAILDSLPVILFLLDENGKYIDIFAGEQNQLYRTKNEFLGKHLHDVFDKVTADAFVKAIHNTLEQDKINKLEYELDVLKGHAYFSGRLSPMDYSVDGKRVVLFLAIDVTEQKNKDLQLQHSIKMDAVGQLTGSIAHDFNNLLTIIIGNLDALKTATQSEPHSQTLINRALDASTRSAKLVNQLLLFSGHQQGKVMLVDINTVIKILDTLMPRSTMPNIEVSHELHENLWTTKIDPGEFENVLLNIISNAREAMPEGGSLTISTSNIKLTHDDVSDLDNCQPGEYVLVSVTDNGKGMMQDVKNKALEPFFSTKEFGKGRGLGLSIVYGFIQSVDGRIEIESEIGKGTVVNLYLPRTVDDSSMNTQTIDATSADSSQPENTGKASHTILVVDDDEMLLTLAQEQIEDLGYSVYGANGSEQALQLLAEHQEIELLFSDVIMPDDLNGYELAIKAKELKPDLQVLLASGFTADIMKQKGLALFKADVLAKPYRYDELSIKLQEILGS